MSEEPERGEEEAEPEEEPEAPPESSARPGRAHPRLAPPEEDDDFYGRRLDAIERHLAELNAFLEEHWTIEQTQRRILRCLEDDDPARGPWA